MSDEMDTRLHEYADRWRAAEPGPAPYTAPTRSVRWQPLVAAAAGFALVAVGTAVAVNRSGDDVQSVLPAGTPGETLPSEPCSATQPQDPVTLDRHGPRRPLPEGFRPVRAIECRVSHRLVDGEGRYVVHQEWHADADLDAFVTMLRQPDRPRPTGDYGCTMQLDSDPDLGLVDEAGTVWWPRFPRDACQHLPRDVMQAHDALPWRLAEERRGQQIETAKALKTGCADMHKDVIEWSVATPKPGGPGSVFPPQRSSSFNVCTYRIELDKEGHPVGHLYNAIVGTASEEAFLRDLIDPLGPAQECDKPRTRFALLAGGSVSVELDGCLRVVASDGTLRQGDQRLVGEIDLMAGRQ